jgi:hypothetical protein
MNNYIKNLLLLLFGLLQINCFGQLGHGVWANENCELLKTEKSCLFFERIGHNYYVKFIQLDSNNDSIICKHFGEIHFKDTIKTFEYLAYELDSLLTKEDIGYMDNTSLLIKGQNGVQKLEMVEKIHLVQPYEMIFAEKDSIGSCLQSWMLGTSLEINKKSSLFRFMAGTNKHSYMFDIRDGFTYCRAARIRSNNNGTYMAQNIRLYDDGKYKTAIMKENNLVECSKILEINDSLFDPDACYYGPNGFYWSLVDYKTDLITLNGCQNRYEFSRPNVNSHRLLEWFFFKKY